MKQNDILATTPVRKIDILLYETTSSYIVRHVSNKWLQDRIATYYGKKVNRKHKRYVKALRDANIRKRKGLGKIS